MLQEIFIDFENRDIQSQLRFTINLGDVVFVVVEEGKHNLFLSGSSTTGPIYFQLVSRGMVIIPSAPLQRL